MQRTRAGAAVLLTGAVLLAGCSGSPSTSPATTAAPTTSSAHYTGTPISWLSAEARPWNKTLNDDQTVVDTASQTTNESDSATFFTRLATACTRLHRDASKAQHIQSAPSQTLALAWNAMAVHTESYASACLTLAHTRSNASLTQWNDSLKAMNSANATLNAAVAAVRSQAGESAG